jgi:hypothetical protein
MAPRKVPKPKITIHYIDPQTGAVVETVHYPREQDGERERTKR